jgi:hypothetical protein
VIAHSLDEQQFPCHVLGPPPVARKLLNLSGSDGFREGEPMENTSWMILATVSGLAIAVLILVGALRLADSARKGNRRFKWMSRRPGAVRGFAARSVKSVAVPSPDGAYAEPADVLATRSMSKSEKVQLLEQWRCDVLQLQAATNEGLAGNGNSDARLLSRIDRALAALGTKPRHRGL